MSGTTPMAPQIVDEAADWFVVMRDPEASTEQRERFADWLQASPMHVKAYLEIAKLWGDSAFIAQGIDAAADASLPGNVVPLKEGIEAHRGDIVRRRTRRSGVRYAVAASVLIACAAAGSLWWQSTRAPTFVSVAGEQRVITLDDGSVVRLNSRSKFSVHMTENLRRIDLAEGQALFEVAKDPVRPFIVYSGRAAVRAVGTQFDVYRKKAGTLVSVVEGRVAVNGIGAQPAVLDAGEQVTVTRTGNLDRPVKPNVAAATSWLQQKLTFDGQPLGEVLEEFNRYTRTPIVLSDPTLAALRVNAVFLTTTPDSILKFIERFDGIAVERSGDEIRIVRRE